MAGVQQHEGEDAVQHVHELFSMLLVLHKHIRMHQFAFIKSSR
jgi:hypothetical protein